VGELLSIKRVWCASYRAGEKPKGKGSIRIRVPWPRLQATGDELEFYLHTPDGDIDFDAKGTELLRRLMPIAGFPCERLRLDRTDGTLYFYVRKRLYDLVDQTTGERRPPGFVYPPASASGQPLCDLDAGLTLANLGHRFFTKGRIEGLDVEFDLWVLNNQDMSAEERMEAALRLATGPFRNPIYWERRSAFSRSRPRAGQTCRGARNHPAHGAD